MKKLPDLSKVAVELVPISSIIVRRPAWREPMDAQWLQAMADSGLKSPVVLVRIQHELVLADGEKHLTNANAAMPREDFIAAKIVDGDEWLRLALMGALNLHGQALSKAEREALLRKLLEENPRRSNTLIARATGFSPNTVKKWRKRVPNANTDLRDGADTRPQRVSSETRRNAALAAAARKASQRSGRPPTEENLTAEDFSKNATTEPGLAPRLVLAQLLESRKAEIIAKLDSWIALLRTTEPKSAVLAEITHANEQMGAALSSEGSLRNPSPGAVQPKVQSATSSDTQAALPANGNELPQAPAPTTANSPEHASSNGSKPVTKGEGSSARLATRLLHGEVSELMFDTLHEVERVRLAIIRRKGKTHREFRDGKYLLSLAA